MATKKGSTPQFELDELTKLKKNTRFRLVSGRPFLIPFADNPLSPTRNDPSRSASARLESTTTCTENVPAAHFTALRRVT